MNFRIEFIAKNPYYSVRLPDVPVGISLVDIVREKLDVPKLKLALIPFSTNAIYYSPCFSISEKIARKSGLFLEHNFRSVEVPAGFLNRFLSLKVSAERDDETEEIKNIEIKYKLDEQAVLEFWETSKFKTFFEKS